jgi:hypothetical protein
MKNQIQKMVAVIVLITIAGLIWSMTTSKTVNTLSEEISTNLEVGKTYQKIIKVDQKDPFTPAKIDTFTVLDKKDGYVKWTRKCWIENDSVTFWISSPEGFLSHNTKLIR